VKRLEAVIFDWAGTTVDCGSLAPVRAVTKLFAAHAIPLSDAEIRRDMGLFKKDHIRLVLGMPHLQAEWRRQHGRPPDEEDVAALFAEFAPLQMEVLEEHSELICGVAAMAQTLRGRGVKLGSTTGYTRPMLDVLLACARRQGYEPDLSLCPDDVGAGRPRPWMCLRIALGFQLTSTAAAVKVGDTTSDIQEGLNAGMWTVGVAATGNEVGLNASDLAALRPDDRKQRLARAHRSLQAAGPHYVIDSVADLEPVVIELEERLASGARP
jgi:phosphonoacetaldehyde hydrolase